MAGRTARDREATAAAAQVARLERMFPAYPMRFVYVLLIVGAVDAADRSVISTVFEDIKRTFDASDAQLGLLASAYSLVATLSAIPFGWIADRWKRVWLIALGFVPWALGMFGTALATSFGMLFVVRLLLGTIEATNGPSTPSLLGDYYPVERRTHVFGIERLGSVLGFTVGLAGGGIVATAFGWRTAFVVFGVLGLLAGAVVLRLLPEPERGVPDALHRARARLEALTAPVGSVEDVPAGFTPSTVDYRNLSTREALASIARTKTLWVLVVSGTIQQFGFAVLPIWTPTFFRRYHGLTAAGSGSFVAFLSLATFAGILAGSRLGTRFAVRRPPAARIWLIAVTMFLSGTALLVGYAASGLPLATTGFFFGAFFGGVPIAITFALTADVIVPHVRGKGFAVVAIARVVGQSSAPLVFGILADAYGLRSALLLTGPLILVGAAVVLLAAATYPRDLAFAQTESLRQHLLEERLGEPVDEKATAEPDDSESPGEAYATAGAAIATWTSDRVVTGLQVLERGLTKVSPAPWVTGTDEPREDAPQP